MTPLDELTLEKNPEPTTEPPPNEVTFRLPDPVDRVPSVTVPAAPKPRKPVPLVDKVALVSVIGASAFGAEMARLPFAPAETKELGLMVTPPGPSAVTLRLFGPVKPVPRELVTTEPSADKIMILPDEFVRTDPFSKTLPPVPMIEMLPLFVLMFVKAV